MTDNQSKKNKILSTFAKASLFLLLFFIVAILLFAYTTPSETALANSSPLGTTNTSNLQPVLTIENTTADKDSNTPAGKFLTGTNLTYTVTGFSSSNVSGQYYYGGNSGNPHADASGGSFGMHTDDNRQKDQQGTMFTNVKLPKDSHMGKAARTGNLTVSVTCTYKCTKGDFVNTVGAGIKFATSIQTPSAYSSISSFTSAMKASDTTVRDNDSSSKTVTLSAKMPVITTNDDCYVVIACTAFAAHYAWAGMGGRQIGVSLSGISITFSYSATYDLGFWSNSDGDTIIAGLKYRFFGNATSSAAGSVTDENVITTNTRKNLTSKCPYAYVEVYPVECKAGYRFESAYYSQGGNWTSDTHGYNQYGYNGTSRSRNDNIPMFKIGYIQCSSLATSLTSYTYNSRTYTYVDEVGFKQLVGSNNDVFLTFTPRTYQIEYDPNGGNGSKLLTDHFYDREVTLLTAGSTFSKDDGSVASGWYYSSNRPFSTTGVGSRYNDDQVVTNLFADLYTNTHVVTLQAVWVQASIANNGSYTNQLTDFKKSDYKQLYSDVTISNINDTKTGHTLVNVYAHYTSGDLNGHDIALTKSGSNWILYGISGNCYLWGEWKANSYTITYSVNSTYGTISSSTINKFVYGVGVRAYNLPYVTAKAGYVWRGWSDTSSGAPIDGSTTLFDSSTEAKTLYAIFYTTSKNYLGTITSTSNITDTAVTYNTASNYQTQGGISSTDKGFGWYYNNVDKGKSSTSSNHTLGYLRLNESAIRKIRSGAQLKVVVKVSYKVGAYLNRTGIGNASNDAFAQIKIGVSSGINDSYTTTYQDGTSVTKNNSNNSKSWLEKSGTLEDYTNIYQTTENPVVIIHIQGDFRCTDGWAYDYRCYGVITGITYSLTWSTPTTRNATFDVNGGNALSNTYLSKGLYSGSNDSITAPSCPTQKTGYTFLGWNTSSTATTATFKAGDTISVSGNTTYYAVWQKKKFPVISYDVFTDGSHYGTEIRTAWCYTYNTVVTLNGGGSTNTLVNTVNRNAGGNSHAGFTAGSIYTRESYSGQSNAYSSGAASGTPITSITPTGEFPLFVKYYWNMTAPSVSVEEKTVDYGTAISLTAQLKKSHAAGEEAVLSTDWSYGDKNCVFYVEGVPTIYTAVESGRYTATVTATITKGGVTLTTKNTASNTMTINPIVVKLSGDLNATLHYTGAEQEFPFNLNVDESAYRNESTNTNYTDEQIAQLQATLDTEKAGKPWYYVSNDKAHNATETWHYGVKAAVAGYLFHNSINANEDINNIYTPSKSYEFKDAGKYEANFFLVGEWDGNKVHDWNKNYNVIGTTEAGPENTSYAGKTLFKVSGDGATATIKPATLSLTAFYYSRDFGSAEGNVNVVTSVDSIELDEKTGTTNGIYVVIEGLLGSDETSTLKTAIANMVHRQKTGTYQDAGLYPVIVDLFLSHTEDNPSQDILRLYNNYGITLDDANAEAFISGSRNICAKTSNIEMYWATYSVGESGVSPIILTPTPYNWTKTMATYLNTSLTSAEASALNTSLASSESVGIFGSLANADGTFTVAEGTYGTYGANNLTSVYHIKKVTVTGNVNLPEKPDEIVYDGNYHGYVYTVDGLKSTQAGTTTTTVYVLGIPIAKPSGWDSMSAAQKYKWVEDNKASIVQIGTRKAKSEDSVQSLATIESTAGKNYVNFAEIPAGTYSVIVVGLGDGTKNENDVYNFHPNYARMVPEDYNWTINPAPISVSGTQDGSLVFGDVNYGKNTITISGIVGSDTIKVTYSPSETTTLRAWGFVSNDPDPEKALTNGTYDFYGTYVGTQTLEFSAVEYVTTQDRNKTTEYMYARKALKPYSLKPTPITWDIEARRIDVEKTSTTPLIDTSTTPPSFTYNGEAQGLEFELTNFYASDFFKNDITMEDADPTNNLDTSAINETLLKITTKFNFTVDPFNPADTGSIVITATNTNARPDPKDPYHYVISISGDNKYKDCYTFYIEEDDKISATINETYEIKPKPVKVYWAYKDGENTVYEKQDQKFVDLVFEYDGKMKKVFATIVVGEGKGEVFPGDDVYFNYKSGTESGKEYKTSATDVREKEKANYASYTSLITSLGGTSASNYKLPTNAADLTRTWSISRRVITITPPGDEEGTYVYDGKAHNAIFSIDNILDGQRSLVVSDWGNVITQLYTSCIEDNKFENKDFGWGYVYDADKTPKFAIKDGNVQATYQGKYGFKYDSEMKYTDSSGDYINIGKNYRVQYSSATSDLLTIKPRVITATWTETRERYTGLGIEFMPKIIDPKDPTFSVESLIKVTESGLTGAGNTTENVLGLYLTYKNANSPKTTTAPINKGTYTVTLEKIYNEYGNYVLVGTPSASCEITDTTIKISNWKLDGGTNFTTTYDGNVHTMSYTATWTLIASDKTPVKITADITVDSSGVVSQNLSYSPTGKTINSGLKITFGGTNLSQTKAGSYEAKATKSGSDADNYDFATETKTWEIKKLKLTPTWSTTREFIYDGTVHGMSYTVEWTLIASDKTSVEITAVITVDSSGEVSQNLSYSPTGKTINSGLNIIFGGTDLSQTKAGYYTARIDNNALTGDDASNYSIEETSVNWQINKRKLTVNWSEDLEFTYNGESHSVTATAGDGEIIGEDVVKFVYDNSGAEGDGSKVAFAPDNRSIRNSASTYGFYTAKIKEEDSLSGADASNYYIEETCAKSVDWQIDKRALTISFADGSTYANSKYVYNGAAQGKVATVTNLVAADYTNSRLGFVCSGVEGSPSINGTTVTILPTSSKTVASYTMSVELSGSRAFCYSLSGTKSGTWSISPLPVELKWYIDGLIEDDNAVGFDNLPHTVTANISNLIDGDVLDVNYTSTIFENYGESSIDVNKAKTAGVYNTTASSLKGSAAANYTLTDGINLTYKWKITPREVTINWTGTGNIYTYNGNYQGPTLSMENASNGQQIWLKVTLYKNDVAVETFKPTYTGTNSSNKASFATSSSFLKTIDYASYRIVVDNAVYTSSACTTPDESYTLKGTTNPEYSIAQQKVALSGVWTYAGNGSGEYKSALVYCKKNYTLSTAFEGGVASYDGWTRADTGAQDKLTLSYTGNVNINVGKYTATVSLSNNNYTIETPAHSTCAWEIKPLVVELDWLLDGASKNSVVYSGSDHTVTATVSNLIAGDVLEVVYTSTISENYGASSINVNKATTAGVYNTTASSLKGSAAANYTLTGCASPSLSWTITRIALTLTLEGKTYTYNGAEQGVVASISGIVSADQNNTTKLTFTTTETTEPTVSHNASASPYTITFNAVNAGTYTARVSGLSGTSASNYTFTAKSVSIVINKLAIKVVWKLDGEAKTSVVYNGAEHSLTATVSNIQKQNGVVDTVNLTYQTKIESGSFTNVNAYRNVATYTTKVSAVSNANYELGTDASLSQTWTISPLVAVLQWDYTTPFTYDGQTHTVTATVSNIQQQKGVNDVVTVSAYTNNSNKDAGSYTATATGLSNANYTLVGCTTSSKAWVINKKTLTVSGWNYQHDGNTYALPNSGLPFDNKSYTLSITCAGLVSGDSVSFSYTNHIKTNAGSYTAGVSMVESKNYAFTTTTKAWSIAPRVVTLTWALDGEAINSVEYNGAEHSMIATVSNPAAGAPVNVSTYSGSASGGGVFTSGYTTAIVKGSYKTTATALDNANYTLVGCISADKTWSITAIILDFTFSATTSFTYNGNEQGLTLTVSKIASVDLNDRARLDFTFGSGVSTTAMVNGQKLDITLKGRNAGDYTAKVSAITGSAKDNYGLPATTSKAFVIKPLAIEVAWSGGTGLVYKKAGYTVSAVVSNIKSQNGVADTVNLTLSGQTQTNAGSYTASVTAVDNANYTTNGGVNLTYNYSIAPKTLSVFTWKLDGSATSTTTYNASNHSLVAMATGGATNTTDGKLYDGDSLTLSYTGSVVTNYGLSAIINNTAMHAGVYKVSVSGTGNSNYTVEANANYSNFTISKRVISYSETIGSYTYNGSLQGMTLTFTNLVQEGYANGVVKVTASGSTPERSAFNSGSGTYTVSLKAINAGSYNVAVALNTDAVGYQNYTVADGSYTYTIAKKNITVAPINTTFTYKAENYTASEVGANFSGLVSGESLTLGTDYSLTFEGTPKNVGNYTFDIALASTWNANNYNLTGTTEYSITINLKEIEISSLAWTYQGNAYTWGSGLMYSDDLEHTFTATSTDSVYLIDKNAGAISLSLNYFGFCNCGLEAEPHVDHQCEYGSQGPVHAGTYWVVVDAEGSASSNYVFQSTSYEPSNYFNENGSGYDVIYPETSEVMTIVPALTEGGKYVRCVLDFAVQRANVSGFNTESTTDFGARTYNGTKFTDVCPTLDANTKTSSVVVRVSTLGDVENSENYTTYTWDNYLATGLRNAADYTLLFMLTDEAVSSASGCDLLAGTVPSMQLNVSINKAQIVITSTSNGKTENGQAITADWTKVYDKTRDYTYYTSTASVSNNIGGASSTVDALANSTITITALYASEQAGVKALTFTKAGADKGNFTFLLGGNTSNTDSISVATAEILKRLISISGLATTKVYDGTTDVSFECNDQDVVIAGDSVSVVGQFDSKNVGNRTITISINDNNYALSSNSATGKITAKPLTVVWTGSSSYTYDRASHGMTAEVSGVVSADQGEGISVNYTFNGENTNFVVGKGSASGTKSFTAVNANTYPITLSLPAGSNYTLSGTNSSNSFTIAQKDLTVNFAVDAIADGAYVYGWSGFTTVYSNKERRITATPVGVVAGDTVSLTVSGNKGTNAGAYTARVTAVNNANYKLTGTLEQAWEIEKSDVVGVSMANVSVVYNKQIHGATVSKYTTQHGVSIDKASITYSGGTHKSEAGLSGNNALLEVGSATITATIAGTANYNPLTLTAQVTITKAVVTGITFADRTFPDYDSLEHSVEVSGTTTQYGDSLTLTYVGEIITNYGSSAITENTATDAGKYKVTATLTNSNYQDLILEAYLTIGQKMITLEWSEQNSFVYSASNQGVVLSLIGIVGSQRFTLSGSVGDQEILQEVGNGDTVNFFAINKGDYVAKVLSITDGNYKLPTSGADEKSFTITAKEITITWTPDTLETSGATAWNAFSVEYCGQERSLTPVLAYGATASNDGRVYDADSSKLSVVANGNRGKDAGNYVATVTSLSGASADNYTVTSGGTQNFTITKSTIQGINLANKTVDYNGQYHAFNVNKTVTQHGDSVRVTYSYTYVDHEGLNELSGEFTSTTAKTAGVYTVNVQFAELDGKDNYEDFSLSAVLTVNRINLNISFTDKTTVYNKTEQRIEVSSTIAQYGEVINVVYTSTVLSAYGSITENRATNAGEYQVTASVAKTTNYNAWSDVATFTIEKADMGLTTRVLEGDSGTQTYKADYYFVTARVESAKGVNKTQYDEPITITYNGGTNALSNGAKNVGTYNINATLTAGNNYNDYTFAAVQLIIQQKEITILWKNATFTYNSVDQTQNILPTVVDGATTADDEKTYTVDDVKVDVTVNGTSANCLNDPFFKNAGTYAVTAAVVNNDNYLITNPSHSYTMQRKKISELGFYLHDHEVVYDTNPHVTSVTTNATSVSTILSNTANLIDADRAVITYTYSYKDHDDTISNSGNFTATTAVNAGIYVITALIDENAKDNYESYQLEGTLTILRATITDLTFSSNNVIYDGNTHSVIVERDDAEYDGTPYGALVYEGSVVSNFGLSTITANSATNAGEYQVIATIEKSLNYNEWKKSAYLIINQREVVLNWTGANGEYVYNSQNQGVNLVVSNIVEDETVTLTALMDGVEKNNNVSNLSSVDYVAIDVLYKGGQVKAYGITLESIGDGNYKLPDEKSTEFTILPKAVTVIWTTDTLAVDNGATEWQDFEVIYCKQERSITPTIANGATNATDGKIYTGDDVILVVNNNKATNVGDYTAIANVGGVDMYNYTFSNTSQDYSVLRAEITSSGFESKVVVYSGVAHRIELSSALTQFGDAIDVVYNGTVENNYGSSAISGNTATHAGVYQITATLTSSNYYDKELTATLTIQKASLESLLYFVSASREYNASYQYLLVSTEEGVAKVGDTDETTIALLGTDTATVIYTYNAEEYHDSEAEKRGGRNVRKEGKNVLAYSVTAEIKFDAENNSANNGDYENWGAKEATLTITPKELINVGSDTPTKQYDGTVECTQVSISGICANDADKITAIPEYNNKNAGENKLIAIRYNCADGYEYLVNNYKIATIAGGIITPKPLVITDSEYTSWRKTYDGFSTANKTNFYEGVIEGDQIEIKAYYAMDNDEKTRHVLEATKVIFEIIGLDGGNYTISSLTFAEVDIENEMYLITPRPNGDITWTPSANATIDYTGTVIALSAGLNVVGEDLTENGGAVMALSVSLVYTIDGNGNDIADVENAVFRNAGTYKAIAGGDLLTENMKADYAIQSDETTFVIKQREVTVNWAYVWANPVIESLTYNGENQLNKVVASITLMGDDVSNFAGESYITITSQQNGEDANFKNAGDYVLIANFSVDAQFASLANNYVLVNEQANYTINKAPIDKYIAFSGSDTFTYYGGETHVYYAVEYNADENNWDDTPLSFTYPFDDDLPITIIYSGGEIEGNKVKNVKLVEGSVSSYTITATVVATENYLGWSGSVEVTVNQGTIDNVYLASSLTFVFDGNKHGLYASNTNEVATTQTTINLPDNTSWNVLYEVFTSSDSFFIDEWNNDEEFRASRHFVNVTTYSITDAGTYYVHARIVGTGNYLDWSTETASVLLIKQANATVSWWYSGTGIADYTYNATDQTNELQATTSRLPHNDENPNISLKVSVEYIGSVTSEYEALTNRFILAGNYTLTADFASGDDYSGDEYLSHRNNYTFQRSDVDPTMVNTTILEMKKFEVDLGWYYACQCCADKNECPDCPGMIGAHIDANSDDICDNCKKAIDFNLCDSRPFDPAHHCIYNKKTHAIQAKGRGIGNALMELISSGTFAAINAGTYTATVTGIADGTDHVVVEGESYAIPFELNYKLPDNIQQNWEIDKRQVMLSTTDSYISKIYDGTSDFETERVGDPSITTENGISTISYYFNIVETADESIVHANLNTMTCQISNLISGDEFLVEIQRIIIIANTSGVNATSYNVIFRVGYSDEALENENYDLIIPPGNAIAQENIITPLKLYLSTSAITSHYFNGQTFEKSITADEEIVTVSGLEIFEATTTGGGTIAELIHNENVVNRFVGSYSIGGNVNVGSYEIIFSDLHTDDGNGNRNYEIIANGSLFYTIHARNLYLTYQNVLQSINQSYQNVIASIALSKTDGVYDYLDRAYVFKDLSAVEQEDAKYAGCFVLDDLEWHIVNGNKVTRSGYDAVSGDENLKKAFLLDVLAQLTASETVTIENNWIDETYTEYTLVEMNAVDNLITVSMSDNYLFNTTYLQLTYTKLKSMDSYKFSITTIDELAMMLSDVAGLTYARKNHRVGIIPEFYLDANIDGITTNGNRQVIYVKNHTNDTYSVGVFDGIFDGQNRTVSNVIIDSDIATRGLFGTITGTVRNLAFRNVSFLAVNSAESVGILAGITEGAHIENVSVSANVYTSTTGNVGGMFGETTDTTIDDVNFVGNIYSEDATTVGGIAGSVTTSTLTNSLSYATIDAHNSTNVGAVFGSIDNEETVSDIAFGGTVFSDNNLIALTQISNILPMTYAEFTANTRVWAGDETCWEVWFEDQVSLATLRVSASKTLGTEANPIVIHNYRQVSWMYSYRWAVYQIDTRSELGGYESVNYTIGGSDNKLTLVSLNPQYADMDCPNRTNAWYLFELKTNVWVPISYKYEKDVTDKDEDA